MLKTIKIWSYYTGNSFKQALSNRGAVAFLLIGKFLRVALFVVFLNFLFEGTRSIAGYNREQIIFFYLSFNLIDTLAQLFFREVYRFRDLVVSGNLDLVLTKPINPLLRVLFGGADILDFIMLIPITIAVIFVGVNYISTSPISWILYILMIINALLIATAFHVVVLSIGVLTTAVDHLIMIYRDMTAILRIPVDLYIEPIRAFLTFVIPLGIMITFPPKVLMGILSLQLIVISIIISLALIVVSLRFWKNSLKQYSSASS